MVSLKRCDPPSLFFSFHLLEMARGRGQLHPAAGGERGAAALTWMCCAATSVAGASGEVPYCESDDTRGSAGAGDDVPRIEAEEGKGEVPWIQAGDGAGDEACSGKPLASVREEGLWPRTSAHRRSARKGAKDKQRGPNAFLAQRRGGVRQGTRRTLEPCTAMDGRLCGWRARDCAEECMCVYDSLRLAWYMPSDTDGRKRALRVVRPHLRTAAREGRGPDGSLTARLLLRAALDGHELRSRYSLYAQRSSMAPEGQSPARIKRRWRRRRRMYYTNTVPKLEQSVYYEDFGNCLTHGLLKGGGKARHHEDLPGLLWPQQAGRTVATSWVADDDSSPSVITPRRLENPRVGRLNSPYRHACEVTKKKNYAKKRGGEIDKLNGLAQPQSIVLAILSGGSIQNPQCRRRSPRGLQLTLCLICAYIEFGTRLGKGDPLPKKTLMNETVGTRMQTRSRLKVKQLGNARQFRIWIPTSD
ncbi:hypothetical protein DFH06DRAFT_1136040 [Mycena polygramma]|nr:hypothetical protein DFH06DRAFT_1136040 [Mycena polygramma]